MDEWIGHRVFCLYRIPPCSVGRQDIADHTNSDTKAVSGQIRQRHVFGLDGLEGCLIRTSCYGPVCGKLGGRFDRVTSAHITVDLVDFTRDLGDCRTDRE